MNKIICCLTVALSVLSCSDQKSAVPENLYGTWQLETRVWTHTGPYTGLGHPDGSDYIIEKEYEEGQILHVFESNLAQFEVNDISSEQYPLSYKYNTLLVDDLFYMKVDSLNGKRMVGTMKDLGSGLYGEFTFRKVD